MNMYNVLLVIVKVIIRFKRVDLIIRSVQIVIRFMFHPDQKKEHLISIILMRHPLNIGQPLSTKQLQMLGEKSCGNRRLD